jgi:RimJ/RimL family protein N-acetyltransferase
MMLRFRQAVEADADMVFSWRNCKAVRLASFDSREISWKEHQDWFRQSLERTDRSLLIAQDAEMSVGVLRFDRAGETVEVSVFLDPAMIGRGYGTAILQAGITWAKQNLAGTKVMRAQIKPGNPASSRVFEKAGFVEARRVYELNL